MNLLSFYLISAIFDQSHDLTLCLTFTIFEKYATCSMRLNGSETVFFGRVLSFRNMFINSLISAAFCQSPESSCVCKFQFFIVMSLFRRSWTELKQCTFIRILYFNFVSGIWIVLNNYESSPKLRAKIKWELIS